MATSKRETHRTDRVASRAYEELAAMLRTDFGDPRLAGVVLSHVTLTNDLSIARAGFVVMGDSPDHARARAALKVLRALAPTIRAKLAGRLNLRRAPEVIFTVDEERETVERVDALLHEVSEELKESAKRKPEGG